MRFCFLILSIFLSHCTASPQSFRRRTDSGDSNTRLGLLGPTIGVAPVPGAGTLGGLGASLNSASSGAPSGCFCIPVNQVCNPGGSVPAGATRINPAINTRIINTNPASACSEERKPCCFGGVNPPKPSPNPFPAPIRENGCGTRRSIISGRAGTDQADFGEYPWMAAILDQNDNFLAAGAILEPNWIITAAHKITKPARNLVVRTGDYDLSVPDEVFNFPHQTHKVAEVIIHPQYNSSLLLNDIALIRLQKPSSFSESTNSVCLPEKFQRFSGQRCYVSGWGQDINGKFQPILREVDLPIVDEFECEERLRTTRLGRTFILDKNSFLCAGGEEGKDACKGDGGAPLVCNEGSFFTVVGLVAWGIGCGQAEIPGVYVNVVNFADFINRIVYRS